MKLYGKWSLLKGYVENTELLQIFSTRTSDDICVRHSIGYFHGGNCFIKKENSAF